MKKFWVISLIFLCVVLLAACQPKLEGTDDIENYAYELHIVDQGRELCPKGFVAYFSEKPDIQQNKLGFWSVDWGEDMKVAEFNLLPFMQVPPLWYAPECVPTLTRIKVE